MDKFTPADGVEAQATQFDFAEDQKEFHIQRRLVDLARPGRAVGMDISIGTPATRFTIAAGWGYTLRGDYLETAGSANMALRDYATGVENLVCACYREVAGSAEAHELDGLSRDTIVERSVELRVFTRTEFDALPTSEGDDFADNLATSDVSTNAQDRIIVLAIVLGKGFTGPTPSTYSSPDLANGNIVQQELVPYVLTAEIEDDSDVTGVNLMSIDNDAPEGTGVLRCVVTNATTKTFAWQAPGGSFGSTVAVTTTLASQELTVVSGGYSLGIEVIPTLLPTAAATYNADITIAQLYEDDAPMFSARDVLLRSKKGHYVPRQTNPHGTGYTDLAEQVIMLPKPVVLGTDKLDTEEETFEPRITTAAAADSLSDLTNLWEQTGGNAGVGYTRFFRGADGTFIITMNANWNGTDWDKDVADVSSMFTWSRFGVTWAKDQGTSTPVASASFDYVFSSGVFDESSIPQGLFRLGNSFTTGTDTQRPRVQFIFDGSEDRLHLVSIDDSDGTDAPMHLYYAGDSGLEFVSNARWNGTQWTATEAGSPSHRICFYAGGMISSYKASGAAPWGNGSWDSTPFTLDNDGFRVVTPMDIEGGRTVRAGTTGSYSLDSPRFATSKTLDTSTTPGERVLFSEVINSTDDIGFRQYAYADSLTFRTEFAYGCVFNSGTDRWSADNSGAGSCGVTRVGPGELIKYRKNSPFPASWADNDWDTCDVAFGQIITDGAGAITTQTGMNYSAAVDGGNLYIQVTFDTPMQSDEYSITFGTTAPSAGTEQFFAYGNDALGFRIAGNDLDGAAVVVNFGSTAAGIGFACRCLA